MAITMTRVALFTLYTLLIGPVVDYQPSKDTPPKIEPLKKQLRQEPLKKDLLLNSRLKQVK